MKLLSLALLLAISISCAHQKKTGARRGNVAMKINENTAHICLGDQSVDQGETVEFYQHKCSQDVRHERQNVNCEMVKLGEGEVIQVFNSHYSEVKTKNDFKFKEGTLVQVK